MRMKKLLTLLFVLILSFSVMLTLTACLGGGNDGVGDNTADGGADTGGNGGGENNGTDNGGNGGENNGTDNGGQGGGENNGSNNGNGTPDAGEGEGDNNSGEGGNADGEESYFNEDGELILYKDGTPTFRFVVGSGVGSVGAELGNIISDLNALSKTNVKQVTTAEGPVPVEILIGTVNNRGKEYKINKYELGAEGYIVKQIGTKIVVIGGSDTALAAAVAYLKTSVFGLSDDSESFSDLVMTSETNREYIQDNYLITSLTVGTASIEDCKIYYDVQSSKAKTIATNLRDDLYIKLGVYIDLVKDVKKHDGTSPAIIIKALENDGVGGGFYIDVTNSILTIECEFDGLFESLTNSFLNSNIFDLAGAVTVANGFSYTPDFRNITYEQYGAVGDGVTDDFFAIKAAHDDANANKLIVHASPNATYYIGNANGSISIEVKTSTYWHGCSFIFDDETVAYDSPGRKTSIFDVVPSSTKKEYSVTTSPIASISSGATNVGFAPGYEALIIFENSNQRRYHRHGANEDDGQIQTELVIVDAEGNIHTSTPVQWTYDVITRLIVYRTDDAPIEIKGEDESGKRTVITTLYNDGPSAYWYYDRNIHITRSNVTLSGIEHVLASYVDASVGGASPYTGFTNVERCTNVVIDNCIFQYGEQYKDNSTIRPDSMPNVTNGTMGSYEISARLANNVTWQNCTQSDFFEPNGTVVYHGMMGTNECKNLAFDNMFTCSFDAHRGVYNVTVKNSTCEHLNFIGAGDIIMENVTMYADGNTAAINHRSDYGSTWWGDMYIDGLILKYYKNGSSSVKNQLAIAKGTWYNWDFFYQTSQAQNIVLKNIVSAEYDFTFVGGERVESITGYNKIPVHLYTNSFNFSTNVYTASTVSGKTNLNKMIPMKSVTVYTTYTGKYAELNVQNPMVIELPYSRAGYYDNVKVTIDGVEYKYSNLPSNWLNK